MRVEVHSVSGKDLKVSIDGDTVEIDHPQLGWDNWIDVFKSWTGTAPSADVSVMVPRDIRGQARRRQRRAPCSAA